MTTKERPIIFSGPMVRAIIEGRKTQTRRIVTDKHFKRLGLERDGEFVFTPDGQWDGTFEGGAVPWSPYGQPGDRLWVREKSRVESVTSGDGAWYSLAYAAGGWSGAMPGEMPGKWFPKISRNIDGSMRWQPSIHMPRWASRITLEVVSVRVERLQDISEADAMAEGIEPYGVKWMDYEGGSTQSALTSFRSLWRSINGDGSVHANPFVWAVEFRRAEQ